MAREQKKPLPAQNKSEIEDVPDASPDAAISVIETSNTAPDVSPTAQAPSSRETIRSQIGIFYVKAFVWIVAGSLIIGWLSCYSVMDLKDLLLAISGILSGPLGFIIGFYFKEGIQERTDL